MAKKQTPSEVVSFPNEPYIYQLSTYWTCDYTPEGCCANGNYIYWATSNSGGTAQALYRLNLNTNAKTKLGDYTDLYHANSITIDAENNLLYVATMDSTLGIKVIDLSDNTVVNSFQTYSVGGTRYIPYCIAFDRKRNVLYSKSSGQSSSTVYVHNPATGATIRQFSLADFSRYNTEQGMETDGEYLYFNWSGTNKNVIYTLNGEFVKAQTIGTNYELEEIAYDWNGKFYCCFNASDNLHVYGAIVRTFDEKYELSYIPVGSWGKVATGGSISVDGVRDFAMESTAATSWSIYLMGTGYSRSYSGMVGKTITIEMDIERVSGSGGGVTVNLFTTNSQAATTSADRLYSATYYSSIPSSGTTHITKTILVGTDFVPTSGKEGSRIGYWVFFRADSGNKCKVTNFRILMGA